MKKQTDIRTGRHCTFNLHVHLVFVTKYRRNVFTKEILDDLGVIFSKVCVDFEAELIEFDGEDDHVHLLVTPSSDNSASKLMWRFWRCGVQWRSCDGLGELPGVATRWRPDGFYGVLSAVTAG